MAERRRAHNVTLANFLIKCLQCGNNLNWNVKAVQGRHVTSATGAVFNTTHLIRHIKNKHSKNTTCSLEARQGHRSRKQSRILSKVKKIILETTTWPQILPRGSSN